MKKGSYVLLLALICLVLGGCTMPGATTIVEPQDTPVAEATSLLAETPAPVPPTPTLGPPTPTNTLVVPPAPEETPVSEPTSAPPTEEAEPPASPVPTANVDPELLELWEYGQGLQEKLIQPLEEMATTLEDLGIGSGEADIVAICTGVDVVLATLAEVQQGLEEQGPPPTDDPDLQECWVELNDALDDFEQGLLILDDVCETFRVGQLPEALTYLETAAQHMENAAAAFERWESKMGF